MIMCYIEMIMCYIQMIRSYISIIDLLDLAHEFQLVDDHPLALSYVLRVVFEPQTEKGALPGAELDLRHFLHLLLGQLLSYRLKFLGVFLQDVDSHTPIDRSLGRQLLKTFGLDRLGQMTMILVTVMSMLDLSRLNRSAFLFGKLSGHLDIFL